MFNVLRSSLIIGILFLLWVMSLVNVCATGGAEPSPDEAVYIVKAFSCPHISQSMQTGFSAVGSSGIYTTLHGVAGCTDIQVDTGQTTIKSLVLSQVDVKDDVALLTSPEFSPRAQLASSSIWKENEHVNLKGHPYGIEL